MGSVKGNRTEFMLGNQAVAEAAYASGIRVATSYPGTPSTEIMECIMPKDMLHCEWSVNEKVALEVAAGYAMSGVPSMCSMKNVGLNVASDPFMTLAYTGVDAPLLIFVVDTPDCFSSQNEQDTRWYSLAAGVPLFEPNSVSDAVHCVGNAFKASAELELPVIVRLTTRIAHGGSGVRIGDAVETSAKMEFKRDPSRYVMVPKNALEQHKALCRKYERAREYTDVIAPKRIGKQLVVAAGICASTARDIGSVPVVEVNGLPIDEERLAKVLDPAEKVFVFEQGAPIVEDIVLRLTDAEVIGRRSGHVMCYGELAMEDMRAILSGKCQGERQSSGAPPRPPRMCAGCPHLATFYWLRNVDKVFAGDIGCYGLGYMYGYIDTCVCMGSSIGIGQALEDSVVVIGDSTFFHSGIPGLINAVNQERNVCVIVMDNSTTAMTGNQPVPRISIEGIARACGAKAETVDPYTKEAGKAIEKAVDSPGVNVVVSKALCRRDAKSGHKFRITERCTDCGLCNEIHCPAIQDGGINDLCVGCGLCAEICPEGAIEQGMSE